MNMSDSEKTLRKECFDKKFNSFGTAKIFERRGNKLKTARYVITFLGFLPIVAIGAFVASFTINSETLINYVLPLAGVIAVLQAIVSLWSIISRWDERYYDSIRGLIENTSLSTEFDDLSSTNIENIEIQLPELRKKYNAQEKIDSMQHITEKEKRYGMRRSLYQFQSKCATCKIQPTSHKPTSCDTCGNF